MVLFSICEALEEAAAVVDGWVATRPRLTNTLTISDHHHTARDRASPVPRSRQTGGPITLAGDTTVTFRMARSKAR
jgi:hypothetical protein